MPTTEPSCERPPKKRQQEQQRQSRYEASGRHRTITAKKVALLRLIAECGVLTTPQLVDIVGSTQDAVKRHLADLKNAELVRVVALPRAALAPPDAPDDHTLLGGSVPNIYVPTRAGYAHLRKLGLIETAGKVPPVGPKHALHTKHELEVREVRVWLAKLARHYGEPHRVAAWRYAPESRIGPVIPDAWFSYELKPSVRLVAALEWDRGTERGEERWADKAARYAAALAPQAVEAATGYKAARLLVVTPDALRRDRIAAILAPTAVAGKAWLATRADLRYGLDRRCWRRPGVEGLHPLVPPEALAPPPEALAPPVDSAKREA